MDPALMLLLPVVILMWIKMVMGSQTVCYSKHLVVRRGDIIGIRVLPWQHPMSPVWQRYSIPTVLRHLMLYELPFKTQLLTLVQQAGICTMDMG
jgi:hypothetical protein